MRISPSALKGILKSKGLTIKTFGEKLGMTREGVYDLMKRKRVKESMIKKVCEVLNVPREAFLLNEILNIENPLSISSLQNEIFHLKSQIEMLKQINELQAQLIVSQRQQLNQRNKTIVSVTKTHKS
jgi:transcriptional regulator with XRE-family HTH domain